MPAKKKRISRLSSVRRRKFRNALLPNAEPLRQIPRLLRDEAANSQTGYFAGASQRLIEAHALHFSAFDLGNASSRFGFPRCGNRRVDAAMACSHDAIDQLRH